MMNETALRAALKKAPLVAFEGSVTRFVHESYRYGAMPAGSVRKGGRYNPPGVAAIYTSLSRHCALAEFVQGYPDNLPMGAASMLSISVRLNRVLDLTNPNILSLLGITKADLCSLRTRVAEHPARIIATIAIDLGIDGIIAPSAVWEDGKNLVIFPDAHVMPTYYVVRSLGAAALA